MKRLDEVMVEQGMVQSRSQAQRLIKLGKVKRDGNIAKKPHLPTKENSQIEIVDNEKYVSRSGFKLASAVDVFKVSFKDEVILDVGSSTGGFTDFAIQNGAKKVYAVDVGSQQLHPSLRGNKKIELHEQTDVREYDHEGEKIDIVVIDVSFISLREVLPSVAKLATNQTQIIAMVKPQFEAGGSQKNKGVIKNDTMRRKILKEFEEWVKRSFIVLEKVDSDVAGTKGNIERFFLLKIM